MRNYDQLRLEIFRYKTMYHITDIRNVVYIIKEKRLLCNNIINKYNYPVHRIDNPEINNRRKNKFTPNTKVSLECYVPFLINPRGPFLRRVTDDGRDQKVVMLGYKYESPEHPFYYTDGNASTKTSRFYKGLKSIKKNIDLNIINKNWEDIQLKSEPEDEKDELKRKHQSEFLIHKMVPIEDIHHIVVCKQEQMQYLLERQVKIPIYVVPKMFFENSGTLNF